MSQATISQVEYLKRLHNLSSEALFQEAQLELARSYGEANHPQAACHWMKHAVAEEYVRRGALPSFFKARQLVQNWTIAKTQLGRREQTGW